MRCNKFIYFIYVYDIKYKNQAFTLIELIVTITILSILGTISFMSFQWFQKDGRDTVRLSDLFLLKQNFEIFKITTWMYPQPSSGSTITYSWALAWRQGTVWDSVIQNLPKINKKPVDPLTGNEYTYSIINIGTEYAFWGILEWTRVVSYQPLLNQVSADSNYKALVTGTYNNKLLRVVSGSTDYVLTLPSIITTNLANTDLESIMVNKALVYNGYSNLPHSYGNTSTGGFNFTPGKLLLFSGSIVTLSTLTGQLVFADNLKTAYSGTFLSNEKNLWEILTMDTVNKADISANTIRNYVNYNVWGLNNGMVLALISTSTGATTASGCVFWTSTLPCWL